MQSCPLYHTWAQISYDNRERSKLRKSQCCQDRILHLCTMQNVSSFLKHKTGFITVTISNVSTGPKTCSCKPLEMQYLMVLWCSTGEPFKESRAEWFTIRTGFRKNVNGEKKNFDYPVHECRMKFPDFPNKQILLI